MVVGWGFETKSSDYLHEQSCVESDAVVAYLQEHEGESPACMYGICQLHVSYKSATHQIYSNAVVADLHKHEGGSSTRRHCRSQVSALLYPVHAWLHEIQRDCAVPYCLPH
jgi:hypothetical protein